MNEELKIIISAEVSKMRSEVDKAKKKVKEFWQEGTKDLKAVSEEFQKVGDKAKNGLKVVGTAIAGAATAFLALSKTTEEYRQNQALLASAFENAGGAAEQAKGVYNDLYRVLGDDGQATEAAQHLAKLTTEEQALSEWTEICKGVYSEFSGSLAIEGLTEAANHTAKLGEVQGTLADALEWSGISVDAFNEQLAALKTEEEREKLIRETLNGLYSESAKTYEANNASVLAQRDAQAKLNDVMAQLGEVAAPIMTMLTELGSKVLADLTPYIQEFAANYLPQIQTALSGVGEAIGKVITWIADNWELVSTLAAVVLGIAAALSVFSTAMGIVNAVTAASPVTWIVLAIVAALAALVAIVVVVIQHWEQIKQATINVFNKIRSAIQTAINFVIGIFEKIIEFVKENWQGLLLLLVNPFVGAFKLAYDNCEGFRNAVNGFIEKIKEGVKKGFEAVKNNIINPVKNAFNTARDWFNNLRNTIANTIENLRQKVADVFTRIKEAIMNPVETAKTFVGNMIEKIKGFFKFDWSLPKLKMPSVQITGKFSLSPLEVPRFSIKWNKLGGVFDKPTLFNYGGSIQGLGEDGAEAVVPLERNTQWLDRLATMLNEKQGKTPIILQVDGKTFAQISVDSINQLTRQSGKLAINMI